MSADKKTPLCARCEIVLAKAGYHVVQEMECVGRGPEHRHYRLEPMGTGAGEYRLRPLPEPAPVVDETTTTTTTEAR